MPTKVVLNHETEVPSVKLGPFLSKLLRPLLDLYLELARYVFGGVSPIYASSNRRSFDRSR